MTTDKKDRIPNAPDLRFPGFKESWTCTTINEVCLEFQSGKSITADTIHPQGSFPVYGGNGLRGYSETYNHEGDYVLIGRQGALCGNVRFVTGKTYITEHAIAAKATDDNDTRFLQFLFSKMNLGQYSDQSAQPGLAVNKLLKLKIQIPQKEEQLKIARFLSLLQKRLETQSRAIEKLQSLISGITQKVSKHPSVQKTMLSDVLMERNEKNQKLLPVYSVSVSEGVVNQVEYLGRSFAAKDTSNYNVVYFGDIVYTKSPTGDFPFGIVKRSNNAVKVAVSPLYGVYQPASEDIGIYLHYYFCSSLNAKNYLHKLIQKGAKNTINITNQRFLENEVPIPDPLTLRKYVVLMTSLSKKLEQEKNLLALLQTQKQFLLQKMFI